jgi:hypothetical protein
MRTFDENDGGTEFTEILAWVSDHEQSLDWIFYGELDAMICMLAHHSPGRRQFRVLEKV